MANEKVTEQLSALLDNELSDQELELLLLRLKQDPEMQGQWSRYHLIGEAMRMNLPPSIPADLSTRIHRELDKVPALQAVSVRTSRWVKPMAGMAVAASVAVMAIIGLQTNPPVPQSESLPKLVQVAPPGTPPAQVVQVRGTHWDLARPEVENKLNGYLVNHSEYAATTNLQGMLNYARIAGYDSKR